MLLGMSVSAQFTISGKVTDKSSGEALPGASIIVNEIKAGSSANSSGDFIIKDLKPGKYTLSASFIGYLSDSVLINVVSDKNMVMNFQLQQLKVEISPVVITATRTERKIEDIPARMAKIGKAEVKEYPATNIDDALQSISNVYVNRSWGIFSKNTSVTMRGLDGTSRTLILLNGVPLNKVSGGQIQWSIIRPEDVDRIEVMKGPGSALYGMNAMGGVINVITKKPEKDLQLNAELQVGSMNTLGGHFSASKDETQNGKGFYWGLNGFYRQGNGYIIEPVETRDSIHSKSYLREGDANGLFGYHFNKNHKLEISYQYHDEKKGNGKKVFEDDGGYDRYQVQFARAQYEGTAGSIKISANAFSQIEQYDRQSETVNSTGVYRLYYTDSRKADKGIWMTTSRNFSQNQLITFGIDLRDGLVDSKDIYLTFTDKIRYKGKLSFAGIFAQNELDLTNSKLKFIAGVRLDLANYRDGNLEVTDPTSTTGFPQQSSEVFEDNTWTSFSPKLSGMYVFNKSLSSYLSFSTGFNPPKLDDLSKSGKISKGFKLANPKLAPETITTYEWGLNWKLLPNLSSEPSVYYSQGNNFQYFVPNGDSIDTGGNDIKPVLQRQNISKVEIYGFEVNAKWKVFENVSINAWYAYNHSKIMEFDVDEDNPAKTLEGKFLAEVPMHTAFISLGWQNKIVNTTLTSNFVGEIWGDEYNTEKIEAYQIFDINLWKQITPHWRASIIVQDIFDRQPIDKKLRLSPGRYVMGKIEYRL